MIRSVKRAAIGLTCIVLLAANSAAAADCKITGPRGSGIVVGGDFVGFVNQNEWNGPLPNEPLMKRQFWDSGWRDAVTSVEIPANCQGIFWTDPNARSQKHGYSGQADVPADKKSAAFLCRCSG